MSPVVKILNCNINQFSELEISSLSWNLPTFMTYDLSKIKHLNARKSKLIARIMVYSCLAQSGMENSIYKWTRNQHQKPNIPGWHNFNISHSGDLVVLAFGNYQIGIDIEKIESCKFDVIEYFNSEEQYYIYNADDKAKAFYNVWTKKEAFLKAIGHGLHSEHLIKDVNCLPDVITHQKIDWHFNKIDLTPEYASFLCTDGVVNDIEVVEFKL
jgi:4'-phosphopantetheinyl transferase